MSIVADPNLIIKNAFNKIASRILSKAAQADSDQPLIYITSCNKQQGKSTIAALLAYYCALISDKKILLIDSNMENPKVASLFGVAEQGLSDYLLSDQPEMNIHETELANFYLLPAGSQPDSTLVYMQHRVSNLIAVVKEHFDIILVDSSSVEVSAGNSFAHNADGLVLVVDATSTRKADVDNVDQALNIDKKKIFGVILNKHQEHIPDFIANLL